MRSYGNLCIVMSLVLLRIVEDCEAERSSATHGWRKPPPLVDLLGSVNRERETLSTRETRKGRVESSDFGSRFSVPKVIERLQLVTEEHQPEISPQSVREMVPIKTPTPALRARSSALPDVSATCSGMLMVRVKKNFYGFTATDSELTLGRACKSNGVHETSGDLLFTYPLTACDSRQEKPPGYILYKYVLHYLPLPTHLPIQRKHGINVDIECLVPSVQPVYQLAVRPTWETPKRKTLTGQLPGYGIQTMNAGWSSPTSSNIFLLGQKVHFQVFALHLPAAGKLYIDRCHTSPSAHPDGFPKHSVIENFGCMVDSKVDGSSSAFSSLRTDGTVNFVLDATQFVPEAETDITEVFLHCQLFVGTLDPSPTAKACTYSREERRWQEASGRDWDRKCECCDSRCLLTASSHSSSMYQGLESSGALLFTAKNTEPKTSFGNGNFDPEPSAASVSFRNKNTEPKSRLPWVSDGKRELKTTEPWVRFSDESIEPKSSTSGVSFSPQKPTPETSLSGGPDFWFETDLNGEEDDLKAYEDLGWQDDYEYANMYEEDSYRGEDNHTHSQAKGQQYEREAEFTGEEAEISGEESGSTYWKAVMEEGSRFREWEGFEFEEGDEIGLGEEPVFGVGERLMFWEQEEEGSKLGVEEQPVLRKGEETMEEEHLHYGLFSGIGEAEFLSGSDWPSGEHWGD